MGYTTWSSDTYDSLRKSYASKSRTDIFASRTLSADMSPYGVLFRESRDSDTHPQSLAVQVYLDVTGSMGRIPEILVTEKLGSLMDTLISHGVPHPQVLFGAIGDHLCDSAPLQVGQFESGTRELDQWLTRTYLEGGGGGQHMESYLLAWLFAARHTSIDCFEQRGQKGFLFTIGDEATWDELSASDVLRITGVRQATSVTARQLLAEASRTHHVFHIHVNEGSYRDAAIVLDPWRELLGERLIKLEDFGAVAETIASTVAVLHGADLRKVTGAFDAKTASVVTRALAHIKSDGSVTHQNIIHL
jgi:hypothetical protein